MIGVFLLFPASSALAATMTLRGTVTYRERMVLPPTAVVEVKLLDVSLADAPARTISETRIPVGSRSSIRYSLRFDKSRILSRRSYALQARITDGDQLLFINTTRHTVFAGGANNTDIRVERVAASAPEPSPPSQPDAPAVPVGRWLAEDIRGGGVIDRLQTVLEIAADGTVAGSGGCNRIRGKATIKDAAISFGPMISTKMACASAAMAQEQKFLAALHDVRGWRIDRARHKLSLLGANGAPVIVFAQM
jgi:putative lipoprotein